MRYLPPRLSISLRVGCRVLAKLLKGEKKMWREGRRMEGGGGGEGRRVLARGNFRSYKKS